MKNTTPSRYQIHIEKMAEINKEKRDKSVAQLGTRWLLHPANAVKSRAQNVNNTLL